MSLMEIPERVTGRDGGFAAAADLLARRLARPAESLPDAGLRLLLLALLYCGGGGLGLLLAQPPGYVPALWLPSGLSLALLLLWGRGCWPGVWSGSFALQCAVSVQAFGSLSPESMLIAAAIASGSTAQALCGVMLVRRVVGWPTSLDSSPALRRFMLSGGALACTIAPLIGTAALALGGRLSAGDLLYHGFTSWVGETAGVFLVAPLLVVWGVEQRHNWRRRLPTVACCVLVSVALGALLGQAWITQAGIFLFSGLLGGFLLVLTGRTAHVEQLALERTEELEHNNHALSREIEQRRRGEIALRESEERFRGIFESTSTGIAFADASGRILQSNAAFQALLGYSAGALQRKDFRALTQRDDIAREALLFGEIGAGQRDSYRLEKRFCTAAGRDTWVDATVSAIRAGGGQPQYYVVVVTGIDARKAAEAQIRYMAQIDALTGLPNRAMLTHRLEQVLQAAALARRRFAVMFIDIDRFKNVNDSLGHGTGDALLKEMARRLRGCVRKTDTVTRHGGDEFVVVLPDVEDAARVRQIAAQMLHAVEQPLPAEQHLLSVTCSIGIAMYPDDGEDVEKLLKNADAAMYVAKNSGRNSYQFFTADMHARVREFLSIETSLRSALKQGELLVHYQPQFDAASGAVIAMEALVRWQHPQRGLLVAGEFIRVAEESGLIGEIDDWVLNEACRQNREWHDLGLKQVPVSVNLSGSQLYRRDIVTKVARALRDSGLGAEWLELEVTESVLMQDVERVVRILHEIRGLGVQLALDDFGTGYSSLAYLQRFPLNRLKVDQTFVRDISVDAGDAAICKAIIALARTLGLPVVAEGVETAAQLVFLCEHRCDAVQGNLLGAAMAPQRMAQLLGAMGLEAVAVAA